MSDRGPKLAYIIGFIIRLVCGSWELSYRQEPHFLNSIFDNGDDGFSRLLVLPPRSALRRLHRKHPVGIHSADSSRLFGVRIGIY
jgi:hypothetical protein